MLNTLKDLIKKGFLHIFSANLCNKFIQFGISMVIVRLINKTEYGQLAYAQNILNIFMLVQGLGVVDGILQFASESEEANEKVAYFKYALKFGVGFNCIISILLIIISLIYTFNISGSEIILVKLSIIPIISLIYNLFLMMLRANLENKKFSKLAVTNTSLYLVGSIVLGSIYGVNGIILANYISFTISCIIGFIFTKNLFLKKKSEFILSREKKKEFIKFSATAALTNSISQMLYLLDTFLIGIFISNAVVIAVYKNATLIPFNLTFIPLSMAVFMYPYFARKNMDKKWIRATYRKLLLGLGAINLIITVILIAFAPIIIKLIFGEVYLDAVPAFRILALGYFVAGTFRIPAGNTLFALKKLKVNFINSIFTGVINIILDIILIKKYGHVGAAIATVSVFIISSMISNVYIYLYTRTVKVEVDTNI